MTRAHVPSCLCAVCRWRRAGFGLADAAAFAATEEAAILARVGWSVRAFLDTPWAVTHGLPASFGHPDFALRLAADLPTRQQWLNVFGRAVRDGRRFAAGETVTDLFSVPVRLVAHRGLLLCVFPDAHGRWPADPACAAGFRDQLVDDGP
jgi:hypothetical protein